MSNAGWVVVLVLILGGCETPAAPSVHDEIKWGKPVDGWDEPSTLYIGTGIEPSVTIHLETGDVTLAEGMSNDEAARVFWDAVSSVHRVKCLGVDGGTDADD